MNTSKRISLARRSLALSLTAAGCLFYAASASAQLPADASRAATGSADPGRAQQQFQDDSILPQVSPQVQVKDLILQKVPPGAENIHFTLKGVEVSGVTVYSDNEVRSVYADKIGATVSLADVYGIATALTNKYRNEGYILTQVVVPPQTIDGGVVQLNVVEGYVDGVTVEGQDDPAALALIRTYASHIRSGRAANVKDLERHLLLINDLPGVEARSILSPSRTQTGAADLHVIVTRDPYDALIAVDNYGSRFLGPLQLTAAGALNSFFGYNERISGQVVMAPNIGHDFSRELGYLGLGYEQPVWNNGTKIQVGYNHTDTDPGYTLRQFDVEGRSDYFSVGLMHPFIRARSQNLYGRAFFDWRNVRSSNNLEPTRVDHIRAVRVGGRYEFMDKLVGVGINAVDVELAKGVDIFDASDKGDPNLTRAMGDPGFFKANAELQRLQRLTGDLNLLALVRGQLSADPLLSSEEFGVGGINLGRGFDPSEIVGDDGVSGKLELQWNKPYPISMLEDYQLFSFFDAGKVWNQDATSSLTKTDTLTSAGFGIRADFTQETQAGLGVAFPLDRDVQTQGDKGPKLYFNIGRKF